MSTMKSVLKTISIILILFFSLIFAGCATNPKAIKRSKHMNTKDITAIYQFEIASIIRKNWKPKKSNYKDVSNDINAAIIFKVLPNGTIKDILFTKRSGLKVLDDSIYNAILKASPVPPHPESLTMPFMSMGIRANLDGLL